MGTRDPRPGPNETLAGVVGGGHASMRGDEVTNEYVNHWLEGNLKDRNSPEYLAEHQPYYFVNRLLDSGYSALITFAGTCGEQACLEAGRLTAVDLSERMLTAAGRLREQLRPSWTLECVREDVRSFASNATQTYDFVELGSLGAYVPYTADLIEGYYGLLNSGGVLLLRSVTSNSHQLRVASEVMNIWLFARRAAIDRAKGALHEARVSVRMTEENRVLAGFLASHPDARKLSDALWQVGSSHTLHRDVMIYREPAARLQH